MSTADGMAVPRSPFVPEPTRAARRLDLAERLAPAFAEALAEVMTSEDRDPRHPAAVLPAAVVGRLVREFDLESVDEAMLLALETARGMARPPISGYRVGAVGLVSSGDVLLGGNLELVGASMSQTVHAEGFVTLLARARGELVGTLALREARPCAHCRQVLAEMDGSANLSLIDLVGHVLRLSDIYPWPFVPGDLGMERARPGSIAWPGLAIRDARVPDDVAQELVAAGRAAHAPYGRTPAAAVLRVADGRAVAGSVLESVAFNPTIGPVLDALVRTLAMGRDYRDISEAWLAVPAGAPVNHEAPARDALAAAAPGTSLHVTYWV